MLKRVLAFMHLDKAFNGDPGEFLIRLETPIISIVVILLIYSFLWNIFKIACGENMVHIHNYGIILDTTYQMLGAIFLHWVRIRLAIR